MLDKGFRRELDALPVQCVYRQDRQCPWAGPLKEYQVRFEIVFKKEMHPSSLVDFSRIWIKFIPPSTVRTVKNI